MAADTELHRRVTLLENDTESISEILTEIRSTQLEHTDRLDEHTQQFDEIQTALKEIVRRLPEAS